MRSDDPACGTTNGNGIEYGVYNWNSTTHAFAILTAIVDGNGECGVWNASTSPPDRLVRTLVKSGSTLTVAAGPDTIPLPAVTSTPGTLVGSFVGSNGNDGMFVVFHADGTYLFTESQVGFRNGVLAGYERGCYVFSGAAITASLSASCRPDGLPALDTNGSAGFSQTPGTPMPVVISGPNTILVGGKAFTRLLPN